MPANIMTSYGERFRQRFKNDAEVKSGFLVLLTPGNLRQDVRVVVYRTTLEHFAVIYPRKRLSKPIGVINLRNTSVQAERNRFVVRQKVYDTVSAMFVCSEREMDVWVSAFAPRSSPGLLASLPVLEEAEES